MSDKLKSLSEMTKKYMVSLSENTDAYNYLKGRGINDTTIKRFALGYSDNYSFKGRIIFPIINENRDVIGFGGRIFKEKDKDKPKYLNSKATDVFDKSKTLYGINYAKDNTENGFILVEGYMDVISMHQAGFSNTIACLGTALTKKHAEIIKSYTDKVCIMLDNDDAGKKAKLRAIPILREVGLFVTVADLSPKKDPDEFLKEFSEREMEERINEAISSWEYELVNTKDLQKLLLEANQKDFEIYKYFLKKDSKN